MFSFPSIALLALGGTTLACLLVPNRTALRERFEKNTLCARILPVLSDGRPEDGRTPVQALHELSSEKLAALSRLAAMPATEQLKQIFGSARPLKYDAIRHAFALAAVRDSISSPVEDAFTMISAKSSVIPEPQRMEIFELLATNALATGEPELASEILRQACHASASKWTTVKDMVSNARLAGKQAPAMEEFRQWMTRRSAGLTPVQRAEAGVLHHTLAIEAGLPGEALDACLDELKSVPSIAAIPPVLMDRTCRAAALAARESEILPWIESYLAFFPEAALSWQDLVKSHPSAAYTQWLKRAADIADGSLLADKAFAHNQRLLAAGDTSGLDRLLPLSSQLGRAEETARLLDAVADRPGNEDLRLRCARVIASTGNTEQAAAMFEEWIVAHPEDRDAAFELACVHERAGDAPAGIAAFEKFLRTFPQHAPALKKLAALRIRGGQPLSALSDFDAMPATGFDTVTLESYTTLAESLDKPESLQRALRIAANDPKQTTPALFLRMAEIARQRTDDDDAILVLREGISRLPQSPSLRVRLAALLVESERFDEALTEALHPVVNARLEAITLALSAAVHTSRCSEVMSSVGPDFEKTHDLPASTRLNLGAACRIIGQTARGDALFASVRMEAPNLAKIAAARLLAGDALQAETLARQNIIQSTAPQPADWILLGDAQSKLGRDADANDAYAKALSVVSSRISKRNAPDPVAADASSAPTFDKR